MNRTPLRPLRRPRHRPLATALALAMSATGLSAVHDAAAAPLIVTNCNDTGAGSLRDTIVNQAMSGDTVSFSASLPCSTITLSSGQITITQQELSIVGPGASALAIDGGSVGRVFRHTGFGTLSLSGLTITHGKYSAGSGIAAGGCLNSDGNVALVDSKVTSCLAHATGTASAYGGGIFAEGSLTLTRSRLAYNIVEGPANPATPPFVTVRGGGAYVIGNLLVYYSTINANTASSPDRRASGGGIETLANATINHSTISGNQADSAGALGEGSANAVTITIVDSTISGNRATATAGAIETSVPLAIWNSTIAFNQADYAHGGIYSSATMIMQSSIVADNIVFGNGAESDVDGSASVSGNDNLIVASTVPVPGDTITACPQLVALADNGGATRTHSLRHTSPAIEKGSADLMAVPFDQRGSGFPRAFRGFVDIGAFESQGVDDGLFSAGFDTGCDR